MSLVQSVTHVLGSKCHPCPHLFRPRAEPAFISLPTTRLRWPKILPMHRLEASIGGRRRFSSYAGGGGGKERLRVAQPATGPRGARSAPPNPYAPYYANLP